MRQLEEKYEDQIHELGEQRKRAEEEAMELRLQVGALQAEAKAQK